MEYTLDKRRIAISDEHRIPGEKRTNFKFNHIFDENSSQKEVYDMAARPILESVMNGFNGTIIAYGQTSSGKTYTMQGVDPYADESSSHETIRKLY